MSLLVKIKKKILDNSNSFNFYKDEYFRLLNDEKNYILKIKELESKLSKNNELSLKYEDIISKLDDLSQKNSKIGENLDSINESSLHLSNFYGDVEVIKKDLKDLSQNNIKFSENLDSINESLSLFIYLHDNVEVIKKQLNILSEDNANINESLHNLDKFSKEALKYNEDNINIKNKLNKFLDFSTKRYMECRKYFFNGYEGLIKPYMNTDFLFNICYFNHIQFLSFSPKENRLILKSKDNIIFSTNNHFWTFMEVYGLNEYSIPQLYSFEDFVVIDIGMNRAYAALNFANYRNCSAVYGFEIDKPTYDVALYNINLNPHIKHKITPYNIGLSDCDEFVELYYVEGFDGLNTMIPEFASIHPDLKIRKDVLKTKTVEVKKTTPIINNIIEKLNPDSKIVLKIDTEGAEYKIIRDMIDSGVISKFDVILGEGHIFSDDDIRNELINLGFKIVKMNESDLTYSFALVKTEYYDYWDLI